MILTDMFGIKVADVKGYKGVCAGSMTNCDIMIVVEAKDGKKDVVKKALEEGNFEEKIVTMLEFRTKDENVYIDDAMLAVFPLAEWNEVQNRSTFKSDSLCNLILATYFENANAVKSDMTHEFDVFTENIVQLTIFSKVKPILREKTLQDLLPALQFTLHNFEQDLLSNLM